MLDEPTTGLDVTTQAHVLRTVRDLTKTYKVAALYVTHDLAVVANLADRIAVMYAGRLVEVGPKTALFGAACHPYTRKLLEAIPDLAGEHALRGIPGRAPCPAAVRRAASSPPAATTPWSSVVRRSRPTTGRVTSIACAAGAGRRYAARPMFGERALRIAAGPTCATVDDALVTVRGVKVFYGTQSPARHRHDGVRRALHRPGGRVGQRQDHPGAGHRRHPSRQDRRRDPLPWTTRSNATHVPGPRRSRQHLQYIFQSPYGSLNPRKTVGQILSQPLKEFFKLSRDEMEQRMAEALELVALDGSLLAKYPDQLSGGERQRVAIARALAAEPSVLICDEVTSSLDVSVQATIVELLAKLIEETGVGMIFVTHHLPLVRSIAQEVAVMSAGNIVEYGLVGDVLADPQAEYTKGLLADTPTI